MRRVFLLFVMFAFSIVSVFAQRTVTGTVTDDAGEGIPGVTVIAKGTSEATITDLSGGYSISVPDGVTKIIFSYPGLVDAEKDVKDILNVEMKSDADIEEVIVTAIGAKKSEKKIGYAATTVKNDDLTRGKSSSALNALQGKVAGVNITSASGAPGASTKVILRGYTSISGNNEPLYVIDGVPINNSSSGSTSLNGGTDFGNQANDINPDDIESLTVLKGSSATALYGSRAANGVIVITTKKGSTKKGLSINVSSTTSFSSPLRLPLLQNTYGQGIQGAWDLRENTSYGPKLDGENRYWGYTVDGARMIKPYEALPNNVADFFEVGKSFNNSVSFSGGSEKSTFYLSYANVNDNGIMPYDFDVYKRNTLSIRGSTKLSDKLSTSASLNYVNKKNKFVPTGQSQSVWNDILQTPRDIPILELADYKSKFFNTDNYYGNYTTNPYFVLNEHGNKNNHDRIYGNASINYTPIENLNFLFRIGSDISNEQLKEWRAIKINSAEGHNFGTDIETGSVDESTTFRRQLNTDFIITYNNSFGEDFEFSALAGQNINQYEVLWKYMGVKDLTTPNFYDISNTAGAADVDTYFSMKRLIGVYGNVDFSYKRFLTLALTGRNDWSSTLPIENNSFFYPSVALSFVFSDAFPTIQKIIPYGKIRLSWARTGSATSSYQIHSVFVPAGHSDGFTSLNYPLPSGVNAYSHSSVIGNPNLRNALTTEKEIGTDIRILDNRVGIDFTYYDKTVTDLIFLVPLAKSSGFPYQRMNMGKVTNKGMEIVIKYDVIKRKKINWNVSLNFSNNRNELVELNDDLKQVVIGGLVGLSYMAEPGQPLGLFEGPVAKTDPEGRIIVNEQGLPQPSNEPEIWGNSQYDFIAGATSLLSYKGVTFSMVWDIRKGGLMYSRTIGMTYFTGISPVTLYNDRQPFIIPNSVVEIEKDGVITYEENTIPVKYSDLGGGANTYWDLGGTLVGRHQVIDKSFVKLRELSLSYNLPKNILNKLSLTGVSIGIVGRNLMLWTPSENIFIDPEMTTFGTGIEGDYGEFGALPTVRSIGINLQLKF